MAICQRNEENLNKVGDAFKIKKRFTSYEELLKDKDIDVVHINTPPFLHADQVVASLEAGKHTACTIPMALSVEDCKRVVDAREKLVEMLEIIDQLLAGNSATDPHDG